MRMSDNLLSQDKLRVLAKRVTKFRKHLLHKAKCAAQAASTAPDDIEAYQNVVDQLARRMHGHFDRVKLLSKENIWSTKKQSKFQKWQKFNLDDKVKVIHEVVVGKAKMADVAKKF